MIQLIKGQEQHMLYFEPISASAETTNTVGAEEISGGLILPIVQNLSTKLPNSSRFKLY